MKKLPLFALKFSLLSLLPSLEAPAVAGVRLEGSLAVEAQLRGVILWNYNLCTRSAFTSEVIERQGSGLSDREIDARVNERLQKCEEQRLARTQRLGRGELNATNLQVDADGSFDEVRAIFFLDHGHF